MAITPARAQPAEGARGLSLTWAPELAEHLSAGMPITVLGQIGLQPPLGRLLVLGRSEGGPQGTYSLAAVVMPNNAAGALALAPFGLGPLAGALEPPEELRARFRTRRTAEEIFILDEHEQDQFVAGPGVVLNQLVISNGSWPLLAPLFGPRTRSRPLADRAGVERDLDAFCTAVAVAVNAIYRRQGAALPVLSLLTLRPTGLNVDSAFDGLRRLGKTAVDLLARLPMPRPADEPGALPRATITPVPRDRADLSFAEVGGQEEAKRELQLICLALADPEAYRRWGARPPKGVLLFGPPGTGKTLLARCLAQEAGAQFIHVRASDITSKWYGEAEKRLQQVFDRARKEQPTVLFFDEIDALARAREESHEATHRIVSTLLENMDGLEQSQGVVVVAATNRPEVVDQALTRPGRFDRLVEVPLPDRSGRRAIFGVHLRKAERQANRALFETLGDAGWEDILDASEGFSGAEIEETVRRALEAKVRAGAVDGQISLRDLLDQAATIAKPW